MAPRKQALFSENQKEIAEEPKRTEGTAVYKVTHYRDAHAVNTYGMYPFSLKITLKGEGMGGGGGAGRGAQMKTTRSNV